MLVSVFFNQLLFFVCQFNLVIEEMLSVGQILNCPLILLSLVVLLQGFCLSNLIFSLLHNVLLLSFGEALKVVWDKSMRSQLRSGGSLILSHDVTHISSINFFLIHFFLILPPLSLSISFLLGKHLIILLHLL